MKVETAEKTVDVKFYRRRNLKKNREVYDTSCVISDILPGRTGADKYRPIAEGITHQNPKDTNDKRIGRKIALTRVLETNTFDKISRIFDKKFRTVVWETYKKNCKL